MRPLHPTHGCECTRRNSFNPIPLVRIARETGCALSNAEVHLLDGILCFDRNERMYSQRETRISPPCIPLAVPGVASPLNIEHSTYDPSAPNLEPAPPLCTSPANSFKENSTCFPRFEFPTNSLEEYRIYVPRCALPDYSLKAYSTCFPRCSFPPNPRSGLYLVPEVYIYLKQYNTYSPTFSATFCSLQWYSIRPTY